MMRSYPPVLIFALRGISYQPDFRGGCTIILCRKPQQPAAYGTGTSDEEEARDHTAVAVITKAHRRQHAQLQRCDFGFRKVGAAWRRQLF